MMFFSMLNFFRRIVIFFGRVMFGRVMFIVVILVHFFVSLFHLVMSFIPAIGNSFFGSVKGIVHALRTSVISF
jgi:hypothetical protein